jgi:hypothetical protein
VKLQQAGGLATDKPLPVRGGNFTFYGCSFEKKGCRNPVLLRGNRWQSIVEGERGKCHTARKNKLFPRGNGLHDDYLKE